jgi:hypothetical protein
MFCLRGIASVVLVGTLVLAGCGGGGGAGQQDWIVGDWEAYAISVSLDGERHNIDQWGMSGYSHFQSSGTWTGEGYVPGEGEYTGYGTWSPRSDGYLLIDASDQEETRLFRTGAQMYYVDNVDGQTAWLWFRRT